MESSQGSALQLDVSTADSEAKKEDHVAGMLCVQHRAERQKQGVS